MVRLLLLLITLIAIPLTQACATDVTAREARQLVAEGAWLLDVRTRAEFAERHLPGSVNIPVEELKQRLGELAPTDRPLVVYCHTGVRAGFATSILRRAGYRHVHNLGTIGRWSHEPVTPTTF